MLIHELSRSFCEAGYWEFPRFKWHPDDFHISVICSCCLVMMSWWHMCMGIRIVLWCHDCADLSSCSHWFVAMSWLRRYVQDFWLLFYDVIISSCISQAKLSHTWWRALGVLSWCHARFHIFYGFIHIVMMRYFILAAFLWCHNSMLSRFRVSPLPATSRTPSSRVP